MPDPAKCRSCGAEIVWMKTKLGKMMPVDVPASDGAVAPDEVLNAETFDHKTMKSHFATCPNANKHRSPR